MKPIGNTLAALVVLMMTLGGSSALGAITANLDRSKVSLGDTLRLTIIATDGEQLNDADLGALNRDFEIIGRSTNNSTSIINGRMSRTRQLIIDLMPRREGELQVPSIRMGQNTTPSLPIDVIPASDALADGQTVVFDVEVDKESVYVQGQLILTLRVQQSINLDGRSISELKLDNAFVKPLEQHSFQRNIDGRPWRVDEVRYAIFPEQSGTLEIPAQVFSGRASRGQRSFFDMGDNGQLVRRSTKPLSITVLPKPSSFTADTWLPAKRLTLQETWSTEPTELKVGESTTRTIQILGEGLQGAQLPPILFTPIEGLKYYPDQPQISEQEVADGLVGIRQDSAAVVAIRPGTYLIPEVRIPWWNTQTEQQQYAVIPEREITVAASASANLTTETMPPAAPIDIVATQPANPSPPWIERSTWQVVSAVSTLGWIFTLLYLWQRGRSKTPTPPQSSDSVAEKHAFKQLIAACADNNATQTRGAIITWAGTLDHKVTPFSLDEVVEQFKDEELARETATLNTCLYSAEHNNWSGTALRDCVRRLRAAINGAHNDPTKPITLYPRAD